MNVVITGATKGIGRAIAEKFAAEGHSVITCSRTKADLQEMASDFANRFPSGSLQVYVADLELYDEMKTFADWITGLRQPVDVLINNAGFFIPGSIFQEAEDTFYKMMQINLHSSYHLTRALLPSMIERRQGHIFNICSVASFTAFANVGSYGISKFALYGLTKILREEMKPFGIKVTAVCPGATFTASWQGSGVSKERLMDADDIAKMVFAASQLSPASVVEDIIMRPLAGDI